MTTPDTARREAMIEIIDPRLANKSWIASYGRMPCGDQTTLEYVRNIALAKADAILAKESEALAEALEICREVAALQSDDGGRSFPSKDLCYRANALAGAQRP